MKTINIDLGGTRTKVGIVEFGNVLDHSIQDSHSQRTFDAIMAGLNGQIEKILSKNNLSGNEIKGIGLAFPGIVDVTQNKVVSSNKKFTGAQDFNFIKWGLDKWNLPVILENDARAALVGEWQFGVGKGCDNIVMMTLGTGIGGVCLIEGKMLYGKHFQAGVLGGHFTIDYKGGLCNCGNVGCVEAVASSWRIKEKIKEDKRLKESRLAQYKEPDFAALFTSYRKGDALAKEYIEEALKAWSAGVISMVHAYDPELVILHGGVMKSADIIVPFIQKWVEKHAWTPWGNVRVCKSSSEDFAALSGVDYLLSRNKEKDGASV